MTAERFDPATAGQRWQRVWDERQRLIEQNYELQIFLRDSAGLYHEPEAVVALVEAAGRRALTVKSTLEVLIESARTTAMLFTILIAAFLSFTLVDLIKRRRNARAYLFVTGLWSYARLALPFASAREPARKTGEAAPEPEKRSRQVERQVERQAKRARR